MKFPLTAANTAFLRLSSKRVFVEISRIIELVRRPGDYGHSLRAALFIVNRKCKFSSGPTMPPRLRTLLSDPFPVPVASTLPYTSVYLIFLPLPLFFPSFKQVPDETSCDQLTMDSECFGKLPSTSNRDSTNFYI